MKIQAMKMDQDKARYLYKIYKKHQAWEQPEDYHIMRAYQLIAQGRVVIQAMQSIRQAGVDDNGLPKLAIARASSKWCFLDKDQWGGGEFIGKSYVNSNNVKDRIKFERGFFPQSSKTFYRWGTKAIVPIIPIHLRPKRATENYHILWEAEWFTDPPTDPYLLRQIQDSDMWVVCAQWDLTEVEKAALRTRMLTR